MTTEVLSQPDSRRRILARFLLAFVGGVTLAALLVAAGVYAFEQRFAERILPGIRIGTVDLSDLDRATAAARLRDAFGNLSQGQIVVAGGAGEIRIGYDEVGRGPDIEGMLDMAFAAGRPADLLDRIVTEARTAVRGMQLEARVAIDQSLVETRLAAIAAAYEQRPKSATVVSTSGGFRVRPGGAGRHMDTGTAADQIVAALRQPDAPAEITIAVNVASVVPAVTDEAADVAAIRAEWMARDVVLSDGSDTWTIPSAQVRTWIAFAVTSDGRYEPTSKPALVTKRLEALAPKLERAPVNATFLLGKGGAIVGVKAGKDGRSLDVPTTAELVVAELARRASGALGTPPVTPALLVTKAPVSTEQAQQVAPLMQQISSWTTYYPIGIKNGFGANIEVPTRAIDGTVVAPGQTFDFWQVVGEVSTANGYKQGGAIINGHTEPQGALAGGICSCSTTMFNAALRAGLQMGARRNHYYYIDRYPLGLDATVFISASGSKQTMSWTNDTPYPILIRGSIRHQGGRGYVTFTLFSVPTGRQVIISDPIVKNVNPATTITEQTPDLPAGARQQIEYPTDGKDVWRTVTVKDATGKIIHQTTYYSHYSRVDGIIQIGTGGVVPSSPSPSASPQPSPTT